MGRRPRRNQHERCRPPDAKRSGMAAAWVIIFLVTVWEGTSPSLCPVAPPRPQVVDCEPWTAPTVPAEALVDAGFDGNLLAAFPPPGPLQQTPEPTCPRGTVERNGGCWKRTDSTLPCQYFEIQDGDACYMAVPKRPKGRPVAGGE